MKSIGTGSWLIENLNPLTVLNAENVGLAKLLKDIFGTSLVPDIDNYEKLSRHRIAVVLGGFLVLLFSCCFSKEFFSYKETFKIMILLCKSCFT